jgi:chromatin-remodeling ATPase INO80
MTSVGLKSNGQDYAQQLHFDAGAEDAAFELERTVLQDYPLPKQKSKIDDSRKRPVPGTGSDLESEMDNSKTADSLSAPVIKKRKLDNDGVAIGNGVEISTAQESISLNPPSKNKGKGKQAQREMSPDSVSVTPKPTRKKPGPKKKVGLALEIENEQRLSQPSSLVGDATPVVSRPTSPALTHTTMVYELDEPVPPMKKAKKVDDNALIKRIKSLEEAQRKVWTNIARRDIAKVIPSLNICPQISHALH